MFGMVGNCANFVHVLKVHLIEALCFLMLCIISVVYLFACVVSDISKCHPKLIVIMLSSDCSQLCSSCKLYSGEDVIRFLYQL